VIFFYFSSHLKSSIRFRTSTLFMCYVSFHTGGFPGWSRRSTVFRTYQCVSRLVRAPVLLDICQDMARSDFYKKVGDTRPPTDEQRAAVGPYYLDTTWQWQGGARGEAGHPWNQEAVSAAPLGIPNASDVLPSMFIYDRWFCKWHLLHIQQ
jgi:hypothetical protein